MEYDDKYLAPELCVMTILVEQGFADSTGDDSNVQDPDVNDPMEW